MTGVFPFASDLAAAQSAPWKPHRLFRGATPVCRRMACHVSVLLPGHSPHAPHAHAAEEVLVVLSGEAGIVIADSPAGDSPRIERLAPGSFVYYPAFQHHTIRNEASAPVTYLMLKWLAGPSGAADPFPTHVARDLPTDPGSKPIKMFKLLQHQTFGLERFHAHLTIIGPGAGYAAHADPYDVAIVVLSGRLETLDQIVDAPAVIYYDRGDLHGMRNVGETPARYLVFEFQ